MAKIKASTVQQRRDEVYGTVQQRRDEVYEAFQYAASFLCAGGGIARL